MSKTTLIYFDSEFSELGIDPKLISIGFISETGDKTFYAETIGIYQLSDCSDFVREEVLKRLEGGEARMTMHELTLRLGNWLEGFEQPVQLATDSLSWDWPWIQEIFDLPGTWPENVESRPLILNQTPEFNLAVEQAFAAGLRRHHSLDDARANRLGRLAQDSANEVVWGRFSI
jgi:hypothetical protein